MREYTHSSSRTEHGTKAFIPAEQAPKKSASRGRNDVVAVFLFYAARDIALRNRLLRTMSISTPTDGNGISSCASAMQSCKIIALMKPIG